MSDVTKETILEAYRHLQTVPSGEQHVKPYRAFQTLICKHQNTFYDLMASDLITDKKELAGIFGMMYGISTARQDNLHWMPLFKRMYENRELLPRELKSVLEWHVDVLRWLDEAAL